MWERAAAKLGNRQAIHQALLNAANATKLAATGYGPSLRSASYWERKGADEWRLATRDEAERAKPNDITNLVELRMNIDGRGHLFCGRATDSHSESPLPLIIEVVIAGNLEAFFALMSVFYEAAGYHGHVDVGVAITGLQGTVSYKAGRYGHGTSVPYSAPTFTRTERIAAVQLEEPDEVAHGLLRHFYEATSGIDGYNPFTET
jgi:hypothetical protein